MKHFLYLNRYFCHFKSGIFSTKFKNKEFSSLFKMRKKIGYLEKFINSRVAAESQRLGTPSGVEPKKGEELILEYKVANKGEENPRLYRVFDSGKVTQRIIHADGTIQDSAEAKISITALREIVSSLTGYRLTFQKSRSYNLELDDKDYNPNSVEIEVRIGDKVVKYSEQNIPANYKPDKSKLSYLEKLF
jgi:hypothetical protein